MKVFYRILIFCFLFFSQLFFSQKSYSTFEKEIIIKSRKFISEPNFNKARSFFLQKEWDSTLVYSMKQLSTGNKNKEIENFCHFFRGFSFKEKKIFIESKKEFTLISKYFEFYNHIKMFLGDISLEQKEFQKAINYFKEIELVKDNNLLGIEKSSVKYNLGICYMHLEEFDKAEFYLLKSIKLYEQQRDSLLLVNAYGDVANLYYLQYKDNLAIPYFEKAYALSKKIKNFDLKRRAARNMSAVEKNRNNFAKALKYREESDQWKDSLNNQNKIWEVAELEKKFAVKQKQKEVSLLQAENKIKVTERNGLFYSAIVLLLLLGVSVYFYKEKIKTNKIILAQKETLDELNATKDRLFSIVSHDLRSSVHAMKTSNARLLEKVATKDLEEIDTILHQNSGIANSTYNLLDNLLHWALLQTKQAYFEITSLRLFFIVEQVAYNYQPLMAEKNILFENTISKKDFVLADQESLKLLLRNFFDNAIKFSNENGFIKIYTQNDSDTYCDLIIEDNGIGMSGDTIANLLKDSTLLSKKQNEKSIGTGLGLQLCKSMIKKNNGKLDIKSELGKGTKFIVSLLKTPPHEQN
ncbi:tetratricopeptide repeat-containing sensor histidine kinase [Flavobacterium sp. HJJ]|uniref:ATP-binding protein n=1 Tax=Flavobacterium sp. HJJ TaxID=2783792 RepID=UPI00188B1D0E|nr:tetratricopeptide repeat-containing sensor histidine kinase [Flavobacterium sp. HJJ]MBF4470176.1 tetratricopeptide repeat-containing sensor histidine kinase [Flavobacterium sp. HJJ]